MKATLAEFDARLQQLASVRRGLVHSVLSGSGSRGLQESADILREMLSDFVTLPRPASANRGEAESRGKAAEGTLRVLTESSGEQVTLDLSYEIGELGRDLLYFESGEASLLRQILPSGSGLREQAEAIATYAGEGAAYRAWITDRDGTVNNYCGRYRSSIQPAYNAIVLSGFARDCAERSVILSSAPLANCGLLDVSVVPESQFVFAGSKGREFQDEQGRRGELPIAHDQAGLLDDLNQRLSQLVAEPEYTVFSKIGSGLQFKFGQTTVARQDIFGSIVPARSRRFFELVSSIVAEIDPNGDCFRIEDTGKDIEVILTISAANAAPDGPQSTRRDFDKGDGVVLMDRELDLKLSDAPVLVCGDTDSDIAMLRETAARTRRLSAVFVTTDQGLKDRVRHYCTSARFADTPDVLVAALLLASTRHGHHAGSQPRPAPSAG
ncbi:MAG TPA: hypothetical protein VMW87_08085 [Spirochaetia bacterium]|nr:hypothetical protein [Spirochaetia bacterium]